MAGEIPPFELLCQIEQRCLALAAALPSPQEAVKTWSGIGFRLGRLLHVAPMGEVAEILHPPQCTGLPGVKSWVRGVANLRGRLLPVLDLCGFLGQHLTAQRKQQRVLVVEQAQTFVGLLVDEVFGMQHFPLDSFVEDAEELQPLEAGVRPFVHGVFRSQRSWFLFSPHALVADSAFQDVVA